LVKKREETDTNTSLPLKGLNGPASVRGPGREDAKYLSNGPASRDSEGRRKVP